MKKKTFSYDMRECIKKPISRHGNGVFNSECTTTKKAGWIWCGKDSIPNPDEPVLF